MVDDELGVGVFARHFSEDGEFAGAHNVDGNIRFGTGGKDLVDAGVVGFDLDACEHDACTNYAGGEVHSSICCSMFSESGSNGLTRPKLPGCLA